MKNFFFFFKSQFLCSLLLFAFINGIQASYSPTKQPTTSYLKYTSLLTPQESSKATPWKSLKTSKMLVPLEKKQIFVPKTAPTKVKLGIDILEEQKFAPLKGKKFALLSHHAGVNGKGVRTVDVLHKQSAGKLVCLFSPEHGFASKINADKGVHNQTDPNTKLPIISLYGIKRRPSAKDLHGISTIVVDLQDVGVRCYTYISCLKYMMEACAENKKEIIVLDRPNPLGGLKVDGPMMDKENISYVGIANIPFIHGLTIGELALFFQELIQKESKKKLNLSVIPMRHWKRHYLWKDTGLKWIPTSPNIPTAETTLIYPLTGLGAQVGKWKHGIGTSHPFQLLSYEKKTAKEIFESFRNFPGIQCLCRGKEVLLRISNWDKVEPSRFYLTMMRLAAQWERKNPFAQSTREQAILFKKHTGSTKLWNALVAKGRTFDLIPFLTDWKITCKNFQQESKKYWLYSH